MRSHSQIIIDAGGYRKVSEQLHWPGRIQTIKSWVLRDNIPCEYWRALVDQRIATLDELATWAAHKSRRVG